MTQTKTRPILVISIKDANEADVIGIENLTPQKTQQKILFSIKKVLSSYLAGKESAKDPNKDIVITYDEIDRIKNELGKPIADFLRTPSETSICHTSVITDSDGNEYVISFLIERGGELALPTKAKTTKTLISTPIKNKRVRSSPSRKAGESFKVSLVDTPLSVDIDNSDIVSVIHFNATAACSGLSMIQQHLGAAGVKFSVSKESEINQNACFNQLISNVIGFYQNPQEETRDIHTMITDDDNHAHFFTVRLARRGR